MALPQVVDMGGSLFVPDGIIPRLYGRRHFRHLRHPDPGRGKAPDVVRRPPGIDDIRRYSSGSPRLSLVATVCSPLFPFRLGELSHAAKSLTASAIANSHKKRITIAKITAIYCSPLGLEDVIVWH